jgi:hypothetical protein
LSAVLACLAGRPVIFRGSVPIAYGQINRSLGFDHGADLVMVATFQPNIVGDWVTIIPSQPVDWTYGHSCIASRQMYACSTWSRAVMWIIFLHNMLQPYRSGFTLLLNPYNRSHVYLSDSCSLWTLHVTNTPVSIENTVDFQMHKVKNSNTMPWVYI